MMDEKQRQAESDGFADGIENVVWRADRHPVECRESYEKGFRRGQIKRRKEVDDASGDLHGAILSEIANNYDPLKSAAKDPADTLADTSAQYLDTGRGDLDGAISAYKDAANWPSDPKFSRWDEDAAQRTDVQ